MLKGLGVKNLRSFSKYAYSELKPLTVYLGRNSSGKSSLIRLFPLLRQSVQETTTGPILWYGKYVDYGNFNEAVCKSGSDNDCINLKFDLTLDPAHRYYFPFMLLDLRNDIDISIEINISEENKKTYTKSISFEISGSRILIQPDAKNHKTIVIASSKNHSYKEEAEESPQIDYKFFPNLRWINDTVKKLPKDIAPWSKTELGADYDEYIIQTRKGEHHVVLHNRKTSDAAALAVRKFFHPNTKTSTIAKSIRQIRAYSLLATEKIALELFKSQGYFNNKIKDPKEKKAFFDILFPYILLKNYHLIATRLNESLKSSFLSVKYLAPIRANSERFYRFQDLQVDEMDHTGSNVAMILNALSESEKIDFQKWTKENFGFIAFVTTDGSHFAIKIITENDTEEHNISDMGYGFSQVLPIIMSIWLEIHNTNENEDEVLFVIEQPELHLHPAYQVKVAQLFAKVVSSVKDRGKNIKFIFETHSQSMIDALGDCIQNKTITKDDVNILIFEKEKIAGSTIFSAEFDDEGYLVNWPVGFFSGE